MLVRERSHRDSVLRRTVLGGVRFLGRTLIGPIVRWERRRATIRTLSSLDDRMLADIGISRNEIEQLALGRLPPGSETFVSPVRHPPAPFQEMRKAA
jgi:uncharacterized protein YjiS (DUF1127 family)